MRMLINLSRAAMYIGLVALIGYYNFAVNGWVGIATNACFFFLGVLLITTWQSKPQVEEIEPKPVTPKGELNLPIEKDEPIRMDNDEPCEPLPKDHWKD